MLRASLALSAFLVAASAYGEVRCLAPVGDMGTVKGGLAYEREFEFVNEGPSPVELGEVRRGCGCLEARLDKKKLAQGEKATLVLRLRTLGQPDGPRTWRAWLAYRDHTDHEIPVAISARIENEVTVEPARLALHVERSLQQEIVLVDRRSTALRVTAVHSSVPALKTSIAAQADGTTKILVQVAARDLETDRAEATVDILTDDPTYRDLQVPVTLTRADATAVSARPAVIRAGGTAVSSHLVRLRCGEQTVRVQQVQGDEAGITCGWAAGPETEATLRIRIDPSRLERAGNHLVRVELSQPSVRTVTIPVLIDPK